MQRLLGMHLGIYPGTFDPIHDGHLDFALKSISKCGIDRLVFLPEKKPRNKKDVSNLKIRQSQIEAKIDQYKNIDCVLLDDEQFTVGKTLMTIETSFDFDELTLLIGSDVASGLSSWPNLERLLSIVNLAIGIRSNTDIRITMGLLDNIEARYTIIETSYPELSSSKLKSL